MTNEEIIAACGAGRLWELVRSSRTAGRKSSEAIELERAVIALHNAGRLDALTAAIDSSTLLEGHEFFGLQDFFTKIVPELEATPEAMMAAVRQMVERGGQDLMTNRPNGAFREWCAKSDRAARTLAAVDPATRENAVFLALAIEAGARGDRDLFRATALEYLRSDVGPARLAAASALGRLTLSGADLAGAIDALREAILSDANDELVSVALTASAEIYAKSPPDAEAAFLKAIAAGARHAGDATIHRMAQAIWHQGTIFSPSVLDALGNIVAAVRPEHGGTLSEIDHAVAALADAGRVQEAAYLLTPILRKHRQLADLEQFDSAAGALSSGDRRELAAVLVEWLLSGSIALGEAAAAVVGQAHDAPLIVDVDLSSTNLSPGHALFLARKAIGFLFMQPITAASVLVSLLRQVEEGQAKAVANHLFDPLLLSYSGDLSEWLRPIANDRTDPAAPFVQQALDALDRYLASLRAVGEIRELHPSERERQIVLRRDQREMQIAHKEAEAKSPFLSIISKSILLYGRRSISYVVDPSGNRQRFTMDLGTFSHSVETPRLDRLEPFSLDYTLRAFRAERLVG